MGKQPIVVHDSPRFATARPGRGIGLEAIRMLEEGVASAEDIDRAMEFGYNHPMGPLRLTDLVGLDVRLGSTDARGAVGRAALICRTVRLGAAEGRAGAPAPRFEPPQLLRDMVAAGKL